MKSGQGPEAKPLSIVSQAVGRPLLGLASDRYGRLNVAGISTFIASVSTLLVWTLAGRSFAGTIVYTLFGVFASSMWTTVAPVGAEVLGLQTLPSGQNFQSFLLSLLPSPFSRPSDNLSISFIDILADPRFPYHLWRADCSIFEN